MFDMHRAPRSSRRFIREALHPGLRKIAPLQGTGLEIVLIAAAVAGTAVSAYSAYAQGQAAGDAADAQAKALQKQADQEREAAAEHSLDLQQQQRKVQGAARAAAAAGGADLSAGAPVTIAQDIYGRAQSDVTATLKQGGRAADVSSLEAAGYAESAAGYRTAGLISAGGKLMSGSSSLLSQSRTYGQAQKAGWTTGAR